MKWAIPTVGGERMYQDFLDILSTAKNGLLDTLGGSLWNSTRTRKGLFRVHKKG